MILPATSLVILSIAASTTAASTAGSRAGHAARIAGGAIAGIVIGEFPLSYHTILSARGSGLRPCHDILPLTRLLVRLYRIRTPSPDLLLPVPPQPPFY